MKQVRKALIPVAGLGTRMFPATKSVLKAMLPVVTPDGVCKPVIQTILEEALSAGCEEIALVIRPDDEAVFSSFLSPVGEELFARLPEAQKKEEQMLRDLGKCTTFLFQKEQLGLGHALSLAKDWVGGENVLVLLGDHIFYSNESRTCARQLVDAFANHGCKDIVSLYPVDGENVHHYGTATGNWLDDAKTTLSLTEFTEKPSLEYARGHLAMQGLANDSFLCVFGQYVLTPQLFAILEGQIKRGVKQKNEFQLTTALDELRATSGMNGYVVNGEHYDTGQPKEYVRSLAAFADVFD